MLRLCRARGGAGALIALFALGGCAGVLPTAAPVDVAPADTVKPAVEEVPPLDSSDGYYKVGTPYEINGVWYYPAVDYGYQETGIASWYGSKFHGRATANGEIFDRRQLTAAHRTLPMPSMVRVTNLDNGRQLELRVNDRGPFARGRIIDISERGAELLGFKEQGTARVRIEIMESESRRMAAAAGAGRDDVVPEAAPTENVVTASLTDEEISDSRAGTDARGTSSLDLARALPVPEPNGAVDYKAPEATTMYVQAGSFVREGNAARLRDRLAWLGDARVHRAQVNDRQFFRVRLGPLETVEDVDRLLEELTAKGLPEAEVVVE